MALGFCFHCHRVAMPDDKPCLVCGGSCGRVATQEETQAELERLHRDVMNILAREGIYK